MYLLTIALTMLVLPLLSIGLERWVAGGDLWLLSAKWFVFWAVGVRLSLAGLRQYIRPALTSRGILGIDGDKAFILVRELGGANIAAGVVGLLSIAYPSFVLPSAVWGAIFYFVAGLEHVKENERTREATIAMASDLLMAGVLAVLAFRMLAAGTG